MSDVGPEVTLVRHGETPWSLSGQHTSRTDLDLTETGVAQALALGPALARAGHHFDVILCSPMLRARRTAELAGLVPNTIDDGLREWDYGGFEGATTAAIRRQHPDWSIWAGPWPDGETAVDVTERADGVVERLLSYGPHRSLAVVAHGHILRVLAARWLGLPSTAGRLLALDTGTISELGWEHDYRVLRRWNQMPSML